MERGLIERVAEEFNITLSKKRITDLEVELFDKDVPYDTVQHLVLRAYDGMGPQGLSAYVRLNDEETQMLKDCLKYYSDGVNKTNNRDVFIAGMKEALLNTVEAIPMQTGRESKATFRINREADTLMKKIVAKYSTPVNEISNSTVLLIGLYAMHFKMVKEMKGM